MSLKRLQRHIVRLTALLVALSILFFFGLYAYRFFFGYSYDGALFEKDLAAGVQADENITNIALFGLDTREGDTKSHSDCMMIASVDNTRGKIKLISLMRDSLVEIDGHGSDKLNAAYFIGGPSLAIRTINENFGTDIRDYVAVEFEQLAGIIDTLNGVEIDVQDYELRELNRVIADYGNEQGKSFQEVSEPGLQTLDGVQATCYGRIRKDNTGDDWGRVERQSIVLNAMFSKLQKLSVNRMLMLMQKIMPFVTSSLSPTDIAPLVVGALKNGMPQLEHTRVPLDGEWEYYGQSGQYIKFNVYAAADEIHNYIYDDVFPGDTSSSHNEGTTGEAEGNGDSSEPLGEVDYDEPPTEPESEKPSEDQEESGGSESQDAGEPPYETEEDPASYVEEGGRYDPETGDYYDSDGDKYYIDDNGKRVYY